MWQFCSFFCFYKGMEINKIQGFFRSISGNKNNTILRQMPCDSVSFSASKPVVKSEEERIKDFKDRDLSIVQAYDIIQAPQDLYDKSLTLIDKGVDCKSAMEIAKMRDNGYERVSSLLDKNCPQRFAMLIVGNSYFDKAEKLLHDNPEFLESIDKSYEVEYEDYKDCTGYHIVAKKVVNNDDEKVVKKVIIDNKGNISKNTTFFNRDTIESWGFNGNKSTVIISTDINKVKGTFAKIPLQIDVVNGENGEPEYIVSTKPSDKLKGAYETTKYILKDYPEDMDMISLIKEGTLDDKIQELGLKQGEKLSGVSQDENGNITYDEKYTYNGKQIVKKYTQTGIFDSSYSYEIKNEDGSNILKMDRSFHKNEDGTTTTIINGKEYTAKFNDEKQEVVITHPTGKEERVPIGAKCVKEDQAETFYLFAKDLPADLLIPLNHLRGIEITKDSGIYLDCYLLDIALNSQSLAHELGHAEDWLNRNIDHVGNINGNFNLVKTYTQELELFNKENPDASKEIISYFSKTGGSRSTGLSELVADVKTMMTHYGHTDEDLQMRINYLTKYFPETVAKVASLYGYNQIEH